MKFYKVLSGATAATLVVVVATVTVTLTTMMMIMTAATSAVMVSAYTFDPLNNMWKPSGARRSSSFASSFAPHPSEVEAPPVFEEEVIRAQYSTWAGHYHNGVNEEHGESFQQKSLVQIEYNKRTGEVSLVDHDGIITKEDYQNLMRAISTGNANDAQELKNVVEGKTTTGLDVVDADVTLGTTHFVDGEDIDPNDVIDTSSQEVQTQTTTTTTQPQPSHHATTTTEYRHHHHHHHQHHEDVAAAAQTFQTYAIPQTQLQDQQYQQLQQIQHHQQHHYQHPGYSHSMMTFQPQMQALQPQPQGPNVHTTAVADSVPETTPQNGGWGFNDRRTTFIN
ncbi:hypothetical protein IV203_036730 [Nitzschia inconspicua]|uniref:EF-hand domain-containing protein n=1 Tax=Nitzschia inconspicua TaxID=303405 RepID=A0A9K3LH75_9STRA|nr:hypothetical protein IV203_036730 [Nitzschia inconspicua]